MRGPEEAGLVRRAVLVPLRIYLGVAFLRTWGVDGTLAGRMPSWLG